MRSRAFTLVELLLALVITSISAAALYGVFYTSLEAWRRGTNESRLSFEGGFLCDFVARDLRGALEVEIEEVPVFSGEGGFMEFFTAAVRAGEASWPVRRVRYSFEKPAETRWGAINLEVTPHAGRVPLMEDADREVIADRVCSFGLRYYAGNRWEDKWEGEGLPQAVEITVEIASDDGRARRAFSTVADLPSRVQRRP